MSDVPSRLLRETLREQLTPPPSSGCLDADLLAAWSDGKLNRRERAMAESHAATCARCQAILAAMAKTAAPLPARKWWQAPTVRWLVPIATMSALAVVVWMKVPSERTRVPALALRATQPEPSASSAPAPASETRPADAAAPAPKATGTLERFSKAPEAKLPERRAAGASQKSPPAASNAAPPVSAPPTPAPTSPAAEQAERANVPTTSARRDASAAAAPAHARPPAELRSEAPRALAETVTISPPQTITGTSRAFFAIQSPNQSVRWRIVAGATVERSTDGGATWQVQSTDATVRLVAGAAPSPTICWIVGAGGIVLVTRDGRTWQRVAFPEAIDLVAIRATDASTAAATTADGRVFSTADGGKTWRSP